MRILITGRAGQVGHELVNVLQSHGEVIALDRKDFDLTRTATETMLNSLGDGMITLDEDYKVLMFNEAAGTIFPGINIHQSVKKLENFPMHLLEGDEQERGDLAAHRYDEPVSDGRRAGRHGARRDAPRRSPVRVEPRAVRALGARGRRPLRLHGHLPARR